MADVACFLLGVWHRKINEDVFTFRAQKVAVLPPNYLGKYEEHPLVAQWMQDALVNSATAFHTYINAPIADDDWSTSQKRIQRAILKHEFSPNGNYPMAGWWRILGSMNPEGAYGFEVIGISEQIPSLSEGMHI